MQPRQHAVEISQFQGFLRLFNASTPRTRGQGPAWRASPTRKHSSTTIFSVRVTHWQRLQPKLQLNRFARRLHNDARLRSQVAEAVGVTLDAFDAKAPEALKAALPAGGIPTATRWRSFSRGRSAERFVRDATRL